MSKKYIIKTDGASKGNPGHAGIGYHIDLEGLTLVEEGEYIGTATNNEAEYLAVIQALERALELKLEDVTLQSDSNLLIQQLNGQWKVKSPNIQPLLVRVQHLARQFKHFHAHHIPRELNTHADRLANQGVKTALKSSKIMTEMPFGKHKGLPFHEIPTGYLQWLLKEATNIRDELQAALETELKRRGV